MKKLGKCFRRSIREVKIRWEIKLLCKRISFKAIINSNSKIQICLNYIIVSNIESNTKITLRIMFNKIIMGDTSIVKTTITSPTMMVITTSMIIKTKDLANICKIINNIRSSKIIISHSMEIKIINSKNHISKIFINNSRVYNSNSRSPITHRRRNNNQNHLSLSPNRQLQHISRKLNHLRQFLWIQILKFSSKL